MAATGIMETITLLMSIADKVMDMLPDYEQIKKEEFLRLKTAYENEKKKDVLSRDDNLVGIYRDMLLMFLSVFNEEIGMKLEKDKQNV